MIFQYTWQNILANKKTQTRRVIASNETAIRSRYNQIAAVISGDRVKWKVGQTYAVQIGRGKPEIARIKITGINSEYVTRISNADAKAEGFNNRQEFLDVWQQIHGQDSLNQRIWILKFELESVIPEKRHINHEPKVHPDKKAFVYAT